MNKKLLSESFDGGSHFQIEPTEDGRQRRLVLTSDSMPAHSDVFLVDHAWTFRLSDAYKQLREVPGLAERMAVIMCVDTDLNCDSEENRESNGKRSRLSLFSNLPSTNQRSRPLPCLLSPPPARQSISQGRFRSWVVYNLCFRSGKNLNVLSILKNCI